MEHFYTIIFLVGVIYALVTFLIGGLLDFAHLEGHIDTNIAGHIDSHVGATIAGDTIPSFTVFPIKPITIVSFITVFGGVGVMGTHYKFNRILVFIVATALGFWISYILFKCIVLPLYKAQNTSAVFQEQLAGKKATVISPVLKDGFGVISYVVNGSKYNAPAQHIHKDAIKQGEEVLIYEIKNNVFYIQPFNEEE